MAHHEDRNNFIKVDQDILPRGSGRKEQYLPISTYRTLDKVEKDATLTTNSINTIQL
jgi:hypothetical protein